MSTIKEYIWKTATILVITFAITASFIFHDYKAFFITVIGSFTIMYQIGRYDG